MYIYMNNMATPTTRFRKYLEEDMCPYYAYGNCKKCCFPRINHSINDGFECKIISTKLYKKFMKPAPDEAMVSVIGLVDKNII